MLTALRPRALAGRARREIVRVGRRSGTLLRWMAIARAERAGGSTVRVYYGRDRLEGRHEPAHGGAIKFQSLAEAFPNAPRDFNLLYLGSSTMPEDAAMLVRLARRRNAAVVWNQNGVAYQGWYGPGYERVNEPRARILHAADQVVYQSEFCRISADRFYGKRQGPSEVLHNPVDTERFAPADRRPDRPTILLGGNQYQRYRFEVALKSLALLPAEWALVVSGKLSWHPDHKRGRREGEALVAELGLSERVELLGPYTQADAPALIRRAHMLLHPKYNDPCPTIVLEAMSCGLPVVYSASGGTPELVGEEAGVGVEAPLDWERDHPPAPQELRDAVLRVADRLDDYSAAARRRAQRFDLRGWIERHGALFAALVE